MMVFLKKKNIPSNSCINAIFFFLVYIFKSVTLERKRESEKKN